MPIRWERSGAAAASVRKRKIEIMYAYLIINDAGTGIDDGGHMAEN